MIIGNVEIKGHAALAPMAGVTDNAFRELCMQFGAGFCISEMISAKAISFNNQKTIELMRIYDGEHPCAIQLFGNEPEILAEAARFSLKFNPAFIDINMGCPAPKVFNNGCGSALMKHPSLCGEIVQAVSSAVDIPVTVKIRSGIDESSKNAVKVAALCEENGAKAVTVHGRTREQYYSGQVDLDIIKNVKQALTIPVIANGDIITPKDAVRTYEYTGCDYIMLGRAALGNPWVFEQINYYFENGSYNSDIALEQRLDVMKKHALLVVEKKGENLGMREFRKHAAYYLKGFKNAAKLRNNAFSLSTLDDLDKMIALAENCH